MLDRLAAADSQRQEIEVVTDGVKVGIEQAVKAIAELPVERTSQPLRTLDTLNALWTEFLILPPAECTESRCKDLFAMVMLVMRGIVAAAKPYCMPFSGCSSCGRNALAQQWVGRVACVLASRRLRVFVFVFE